MKKKIDEFFEFAVTEVSKESRTGVALIYCGGLGLGICGVLCLGDMFKYAQDHKWLMFGWMIVVTVIMASFFLSMASIGTAAIDRITEGKKDEDRD